MSILAVLLLSGITVFDAMPRDDMPPFLIRYMSVVTHYPGAGPERIENLISDKIEKVVQEVPEVDYITSESRTGISVVSISLKESVTELQPVFDRLRRKVESVEPDLPDGSVISIDDEVGDVFGIIVGLTAEGYSPAEIKDIADDVRDELIKLPEAAKVEISGYQTEKIYVEFNDARFADIGLTKAKLEDLISRTNIIIPGGEIAVGDQRIILEPTGNFEQVADIENIIVSSINGRVLRLKDVAAIRRGYEEPRKRLVRINGMPGVSIAVNLKKEGNIISLGRQVDRKIAELAQAYPYGVEFERISSQDMIVEKSVNDFLGNLIQAVVVVLLVMLAFLGLRTGAIVASLIPSAILLTLLLMSVANVGLNQVTLASLTIPLGLIGVVPGLFFTDSYLGFMAFLGIISLAGIVINNAIVLLDRIEIEETEFKKSPAHAIVDAGTQRFRPILLTTATTSLGLIPLWIGGGLMWEPMAISIIFGLLFATLLTLVFVPVLYKIFFNVGFKTYRLNS